MENHIRCAIIIHDNFRVYNKSWHKIAFVSSHHVIDMLKQRMHHCSSPQSSYVTYYIENIGTWEHKTERIHTCIKWNRAERINFNFFLPHHITICFVIWRRLIPTRAAISLCRWLWLEMHYALFSMLRLILIRTRKIYTMYINVGISLLGDYLYTMLTTDCDCYYRHYDRVNEERRVTRARGGNGHGDGDGKRRTMQ